MKQSASHWYPGIVLFVLSLCIGLFCYKDFGFAWDESIQRLAGTSSYDYIFNNSEGLKNLEYRDLGTGFELPLVFIQKWLKLDDLREITQMRHLVTHIFFLISVFCGYILALKLFKNQFVACMGFILLAFHPRIYAHSYFNSKDIPFLSMFIITFLISHIAFEKNKTAWYFILGLACGYTTSIRAMGIMLAPCIGAFFLIDMYMQKTSRDKLWRELRNMVVFGIGFCAMLYLAWPILWSNPIHYFLEEFKSLAHINWDGDVLFMGKTIKGNKLPWTYIPVWFAISTPEVWLLAGVAGIIWIGYLVIKHPLKFLANSPDRQFLLYLVCLLGPVLVVIVLRSVNYDDWRHLYFIYPAFVMLALFVIHKLVSGNWKRYVHVVCLIQFIFTAVFIIKEHPLEQIYFNHFVSHKNENIRHKFDMDYWGTSYRMGFEYILAHDTASRIQVSGGAGPIYENLGILTKEQRKRIMIVSENENPDYFITVFRYHPDDYNYKNIFYSYKILNSTVLRIYKTH